MKYIFNIYHSSFTHTTNIITIQSWLNIGKVSLLKEEASVFYPELCVSDTALQLDTQTNSHLPFNKS